MKTKVYYLIPLLLFVFTYCKKNNTYENEKQDILKRLDRVDIQKIDPITGEVDENFSYVNDTVFYNNSSGIDLYIKGKKYENKYSAKTEDSIINLFHLKKIKFDFKKSYQNHFEYEDCMLKQKMKMDSGVVHTLQAEKGAVYQIIDIRHKPILLQICYKGKTYEERIKSGYNRNYNKLLGYGDSNAILYDVDKDGENELLVLINEEGNLYSFADVYKINLPK